MDMGTAAKTHLFCMPAFKRSGQSPVGSSFSGPEQYQYQYLASNQPGLTYLWSMQCCGGLAGGCPS